MTRTSSTNSTCSMRISISFSCLSSMLSKTRISIVSRVSSVSSGFVSESCMFTCNFGGRLCRLLLLLVHVLSRDRGFAHCEFFVEGSSKKSSTQPLDTSAFGIGSVFCLLLFAHPAMTMRSWSFSRSSASQP